MFRSNSGQKCSLEPEQKGCSGTGTGIPVDLCVERIDNAENDFECGDPHIQNRFFT